MAAIFIIILALCVFPSGARSIAQLFPGFYDESCRQFQEIVRDEITQVVHTDPPLAASLLKLQFRDCFGDGCVASLLLNQDATFPNSERCFDVIDRIKTKVEAVCPGIVSCADILAVTARDSVALLGGPSWPVHLGRRDAVTSSQSAGNKQIASPSADLATLISMFEAKGLTARDMVVLFGAHTIGEAQCKDFKDRIYNETNIDLNFATSRRSSCPSSGGDMSMAPLDILTPVRFDNNYYRNLVAHRGLLHSDQELFNEDSLDASVRLYSENIAAFFRDFPDAMLKMANIGILTGTRGKIRKNCRVGK